MADDDFKFDAAMMGRLAGALSFVVGSDHGMETVAETIDLDGLLIEAGLKGADDTQVVKIGQIGVSKLSPSSYVLTLIIKDELADKDAPPLVRSIDFNVVD